ncbi:iron ABC transporter substrate-binding protein [Lichenicoccus sp.]|uniref:iron ABC transporter substrate-binding protein n=1 Tax=Lichenicoccus sp. TaxID=2781899 RepID=UPI003D0A64ED
MLFEPRRSATSGRRAVLLATMPAALALSAVLAGPAGAAETLTLYSGQHEQTVDQLVDAFRRQTGIVVRVHTGEGPELANQLLTEGGTSAADVYFTENSPELQLLAEHGLLAPVDAATRALVPARYSSSQGQWLGVLARQNVLAYNTARVEATALPASVLDLAGPAWKGRVGIAPSDGDFLPLVSAVIAMKGEAGALAWLRGLQRNAQSFDDDEGVVAAVDRGAVATGIVNNYYWERLREERGAHGMRSAIHEFAPGDVGALVNVSGAAVLNTSRHQSAAQRFLAFLVSAPTQASLGRSNVTFEYPLRPGVAANAALPPLDTLSPPDIGWSRLGDDSQAVALLRKAGLL